jgi:hypothetical protein
VKERTEEQKSLAEMNLDESYQKFIRGMEYLMGRPLTRQEINYVSVSHSKEQAIIFGSNQ